MFCTVAICFQPVITKPTRATDSSATLTDHILKNDFDIDASHHQGMLCSSISDHYAIFHATGNVATNDSNMIKPIARCDMCHKNLLKYVNEMKRLNWQCMIDETDPQFNSNNFHEIVSIKYNVCFPYRKFTKKYRMSKPWLSAAPKELIKEKNKSF